MSDTCQPESTWVANHPAEIANRLHGGTRNGRGDCDASYRVNARGNETLLDVVVDLAARSQRAPERLVGGNERALITWFYDGGTAHREAISEEVVDEYLRTFSGGDGVLGAMGVYRAHFTKIQQMKPLLKNKLIMPLVTLAGEKGLG